MEQKIMLYKVDCICARSSYSVALSIEKLVQKMTYNQLLSSSSHEVSVLKDDNERLQKKVQFLQIGRDSSLGDTVIATPGLQVTAHRAILAAKSPVFKEMVQSDIADKRAEGIKIHDVSAAVIEAVVEFCYTGELTSSELVRADEVLRCAHTFQLGLLMEYCDAELCRGLTIENLPQISRKFNATRLQEEARKIFKDNFDLVQSKVFGVLLGSAGSTAEICSGACLKLDEHPDEEWNTV